MQPNLPSHQLDSSPVKANANITLSDVFPTPPRTANLESSPAPKRILDRKRDIATPSESTDENHLQKSTRIHAGDLPSASALTTAWDRQQFSKKRSQYYGEVFAYREPHNTAKDRVVRDSMIVAEIKLNCKVSDPEIIQSRRY